MKERQQLLKFFPCFYASFFIGMIALEVGVILPFLMEELSLSYSLAGGILSAFAIGNLAASLLNPVLFRKVGNKSITIFFSVILAIALFIITLSPGYSTLYGLIILLGIGRGTINIYVYTTANKSKDGKTIYVHLLSVVFALGALSAPLITSFLLFMGLNWRQLIYVFLGFSILVPILLIFCRSRENQDQSEEESTEQFAGKSAEQLVYREGKKKEFYKETGFYVLGGILFCYIGLENCVNGWFVQYFKDMNIMPAAYANMLVSITWLLILAGRLATTVISTKIRNGALICLNCIGAACFFIIMIITKNSLMIMFAICGLGFFCAGIYPACIASSKRIINSSTSGMSLLLAFSSLGGIIIPQIIGIIADHLGLVSAIFYLIVIMVSMVTLALLNCVKVEKSR